MRLPPQPGEVIDREAGFSFRWNGARCDAYQGDTIVSALAAAGERVFSRSLKHHRPRGLLTADFHDPGCVVRAGAEPNVRGAHRLVEPGMDVRAQGVWPSLRHDLKAANRLLGPVLPAGFYYKTFIRPRALWPAYERVLRRFSPGGPVPPAPTGERYDHRHVHPDVLVVGGGPAGMAAAVAAAAEGARVLLVDEQHALGGHLRWGDQSQRDLLRELRAALDAADSVEVMTDAVVTGCYDGRTVAVLQRSLPGVTERLVTARPKQLVLAPGVHERPYVVAGNDLPGVMLSTAARRLVRLYAVRPGHRAVVLTANPEGDAAAAELDRAGVDVCAVLDARRGEDVVRVRGRGGVRAVDCAGGRRVECDLLVTAVGWSAPTSLLTMAGGTAEYDARSARFRPAHVPDGVLVTGGLAGDGAPSQLVEHGRAIGREAARRATGTGTATAVPGLRAEPHPALFQGSTDGIVDFSEDVSATDLRSAVAEGYDSIELVKRYTTATMGPTQGKLEAVNTIAVVAAATGRGIAETGATTGRPPYAPVSLGALAGRGYQPVRRSPLHAWHERHGAVPLVAGEWVRPEHYGDPTAEVRAVRQGVGIIDVTPLGKFDLRGEHVPDLLELLYVNRWRRLPVGSVRYGVMCGEDGVVLDDGVTGRLGEARYLMTATSSGAGAVGEWVERWLQTERPDWDVRMVPVTDAYASINVAGPLSRELVRRLTDIDVSAEAFPYLRVREGRVADAAGCVLWRIGFTGELSYELHVPAGRGPAVWAALLDAGADLGVRPFGVEAQRILRLEKGHLIVGQDTDGLTNAFGAGLGWAVKLDKDDFAGRPELQWHAGDRPLLVGLQPVEPDVVPPEASQVVDDGHRVVGRVTSSRMSPTLGRAVCLALLDPAVCEPGATVTVLLPAGGAVSARVLPSPVHVDPGGERLRG